MRTLDCWPEISFPAMREETRVSLRYAENIGSALKIMRIKRGISQVRLAKLLSRELEEQVMQSYISRIEKGSKGGGISWDRLGIFCKVLRCKPSQIVAMAEFLASQSLRETKDVLAALKAAARKRLAQEGGGNG